MPASTKAELIETTEREFNKLIALVDPIEEADALIKDEDDTSIKDVVSHRAHWIELFLGWYRDGQDSKEVHFPAPGYKWNQLKRYNADLRAKQTGLGWKAARRNLLLRSGDLLNLINDLDQNALYGAPMEGAKNHWTTGRWAEAAGASHFRSARTYIRKRLKALDAARPA